MYQQFFRIRNYLMLIVSLHTFCSVCMQTCVICLFNQLQLNVCCMFVAKRTGLAAAAVDIEDGAGEGWGDDADLVLDDGKENMSHFNKPKYHICI